jgi:hypothetical protein
VQRGYRFGGIKVKTAAAPHVIPSQGLDAALILNEAGPSHNRVIPEGITQMTQPGR